MIHHLQIISWAMSTLSCRSNQIVQAKLIISSIPQERISKCCRAFTTMSCTFSRFVLTLLGWLLGLGCAFESIHLASDGCCDIVCLQKIVGNIGCMHQKAKNRTLRFFRRQRLTACHRRPPKETWPIFLISHFLAQKIRYSYFRPRPSAIIGNITVRENSAC